MPQSLSFLETWRHRVAEHGWSPKVDLSDGAVVLGAGTVLATTRDGREAGHDRLVALLATAYRGRIPAAAPAQIWKALDAWQQGERFIAAAHIAYASLPTLNADDAYRLSLADFALSRGMAPNNLLKELGYADLAIGLLKYDPTQPRVPAGQGSNSGQWTKDTSSDSNSAPSRSNGAPTAAPSNQTAVAAAGGIDAVCEALYQIDLVTCRAKRSRACYAQAAERYSACLAGTQIPPLNF